MGQLEAVDASSSDSGTVSELLAFAAAALTSAVDSPRLEAELLLAYTSGFKRSSIMAFPERQIAAAGRTAFAAAIERRAEGEPLAHITGQREFFSLPLNVSADVLVPRPETEMLVEAALESLADVRNERVLDLGTGSGAIALALKHARPDLDVTAVDRELRALRMARENGRRLSVDIEWLRSDWFAALPGRIFELIVSNPPYVRSADPHFAGPLKFEPREALDGGADGLAAFGAILLAAPAHLTPDGLVLLEHGFDQRQALTALAAEHGYRVAFARNDCGGKPRVLALRPMHQDCRAE